MHSLNAYRNLTSVSVEANGVQYSDLSQIGCLGNIRAIHGEAILEQPVRFWGELVEGCSVGAFSYMQGNTTLYNTEVGRFCSIASGVVSGPGEHPTNWLSSHPFVCSGTDAVIGIAQVYPEYNLWLGSPSVGHRHTRRVVVGNDVWVGQNAIISQGVRVGDGAIIAAGAVVTKDVEAYSIVGGVPAKHIKFRFDGRTIERLLKLRFWDYDLSPITSLVDYAKVSEAIDLIESGVDSGIIQPLRVRKFRVRDGLAEAIDG